VYGIGLRLAKYRIRNRLCQNISWCCCAGSLFIPIVCLTNSTDGMMTVSGKLQCSVKNLHRIIHHISSVWLNPNLIQREAGT